MNILVTGCCGVVSRSIVRSIKSSAHYASARIIGVDVCDNWYGLHDPLFDKVYRVSGADHTAQYCEQISNISAMENIDLAVVTPEREVLIWSQNAFEIPVSLPPPEFSKFASNKRKLSELLIPTGLVPDFATYHRAELLDRDMTDVLAAEKSFWMRDCSVGTDSGKGALKVNSAEEVRAWALLNPNVDQFVISSFLPGRNFAQCMLFNEGKLLKSCAYERLEYFMGEVAPSGITGNICRGKLVNEQLVLKNAEAAVMEVCRHSKEEMTGLVTVDLREDENGMPLITEINIRHTAPTSAYAAGGSNMVEAQIHHTLGRLDLIDSTPVLFPADNYILRDIDGQPIWVEEMHLPAPGTEFQSGDITPG